MNEILDNFFNQLYLNKYICLEDWIKKYKNIPKDNFIKFIEESFDTAKYISNENQYILNIYKEYENYKNEIDSLSTKIDQEIQLSFQIKSLLDKIKSDVKLQFKDEIDSIDKNIKEKQVIDSQILNNYIKEMSKFVLNDLLKDPRIKKEFNQKQLTNISLLKSLVKEYNQKILLMQSCYRKIFCLLFFSKQEIFIENEKRTYIYYSNSEKIFITSDFIAFQKLIKYLSDKKDDFQTPRTSKYLETLTKKLKKISKFSNMLLQKDIGSENIYEQYEPPELKSLIREVIELINFRSSQFAKENNLFYRGHSDSNYTLTPSISRNPKLIENENRLYHETIIRCSDFFQNSNHNLEILTLMQHYSIPTRLLDVSANPLAALYFAVCDNKETDGEIVIFCAKENEIKYYHSDTVEILSTLSILNHSEKTKLENEILNIAKMLIFELLEILNNNGKINNGLLDEEINKCIETFNSLYVTKKLVHEIGKRSSHFQNVINPFHLYNSYFVLPIMNNSRITRQSGAFIITGLHNKEDSHQNLYTNKYHLPSSFNDYIYYFKEEIDKKEIQIIEGMISSDKKFKDYIKNYLPLFVDIFNTEYNFTNDPNKLKKLRIIIPSTNNKTDFSDWLTIFDINQATIYPEIEKVGEYLNIKYNK